MDFFRQEVDAAVDALLMQQVILVPTAAGWALACDAEVPPAVARLRELAGPAATEERRLTVGAPVAVAAAPVATVAAPPAEEFTHKLTRRLGHPVLTVVVGATFADVPAALAREVEYVVNWGR